VNKKIELYYNPSKQFVDPNKNANKSLSNSSDSFSVESSKAGVSGNPPNPGRNSALAQKKRTTLSK
jgi:hypothetical protein